MNERQFPLKSGLALFGLIPRSHLAVDQKEATMKTPSLLGWYRVLRTHHNWTVFQAIRYAMWLAH